MKKILSLAAVLVFAVSSMFAWTNIVGVGVKGSFPTATKETITEVDSKEIKNGATTSNTFNSTGLNFSYIGFFDNGLAFKDNSSVGFGSIKGDFADFCDLFNAGSLNIGVTELVGVGYGIVRTDNIFLGLFGNIGLDVNVGIASQSSSSSGIAGIFITDAFVAGADVTFVYTPSSTFSIYTSISADVGLGAAASAISTKVNNKVTTTDSSYNLDPYFLLVPTVGVAWRF